MHNKKLRAKAVSIDQRFIDARSKFFKALIKAENNCNIQETVILLQELLDAYIELIRLKIATKSISCYTIKEKEHKENGKTE